MTPRELVPRESEIAVIGLAKSGRAVSMLLRKHGYNVYASDVASSPETGRCAEELRAQGIVVEVALNFLDGPRIIAITGTNGKTTTTALIAHLLRGLDLEAVEAGNIGTPLSEIAARERSPSWISLEMSSFQLHDTPSR